MVATRLPAAESACATYERTAIRLFYEKAARGHGSFRALLLLMLVGTLLAFNLLHWADVLLWVGLLILGELAIAFWYYRVFARARSPDDDRRALNQLVTLAAVMVAIYSAPFLGWTRHAGLGAAIGAALSLSVLLVIAAQHNLTRGMFYSSAVVPAVGLVLNTLALDGGAHRIPLAIMAGGILMSARNMQLDNADNFRSLVEMRLAAEATNAELRAALIAAEASSRAKSVFLATMGHELRTPLNGVIGMADALARSAPSAEAAFQGEVIRRSGEELLARLDDVLHLSLAESGEIQLSLEAFNCGVVACEVADGFRRAAGEKSLEIGVDVERTLGERMGDVACVRQILRHLVSNAIKFTEAGSVRIRVWPDPEDHMNFEVSDTGPGLAAGAMATLFDRFVQGDGSSTRRQGGLGVGLSICQDVARRMRGDVAVRSRPGLGSTFTLRLPLPPVPAPQAALAPPPRTAAPPTRVRVLCAEDNPTNRQVLQTLLRAFDCEASMVVNGDEALRSWRDEHFDLVLMDIQMPVMDGLAAMRAIRAEEATRRRPRTPLVAVTADAMSHQIAEQIAAGADLHLPKPIQTSALSQAIARAIALGREPGGSPISVPA